MSVIWKERTNKRVVQRPVLSKITQSTLVTLGGANLSDYLKMIPKTVTKIISFEKDWESYMAQLIDIQLLKRKGIVEIRKEDIDNCPIMEDTFYDMDFKCTLPTCSKIVKKFRHCPFSLTISHRPYKVEATPEFLCRATGAKLLSVKVFDGYKMIETTLGRYKWTTYRDKITMSTITNFEI